MRISPQYLRRDRLKRFTFILWGTLFLILCPLQTAYGKQFTVGVYDFYPICHSHEQFNPSDTNFFPDILDYIAEKEGWTLQYLPGTLPDLLERLQKNHIDLLVAVPFAPARKSPVKFNKENVISTWAQVYTHKNDRVDNLLDLSSRSIGVLRDDPYNAEIRHLIDQFDLNCRIMEFKHYPDLLEGLEQRWIHSAVVDRLSGFLYEKQFEISKTPIVFSPIALRFALAPRIDTGVVTTIDYYLRELKQDPESFYHDLLNKIMVPPEDNRLIGWLPWALGGAFFSTIAALLLSFVFKRQVAAKTRQILEKNTQLKDEIQSRMAVESALKQSNLLNEKTLANMRDGLLLIDPTGNKILKANPAAAEMFGFSYGAMLQVIPDRLHADSEKAAAFYDHIQRSVALNGFFSGRWDLRRNNRQIFPVEISVTPILLDETAPGHSWVVTIRDITEKIASECALEQSRLELGEAKKMEAIGRLAGGVAHDFNNLLMGIQGRASMMMLNLNPASPHAIYLKEIEECVNTAASLVGQLLGFARGGKYEVKPTNINEVLSATADMFGRTRKEITIKKQFQQTPWPVEADQGQLKQVFLNMFVNAWQAMPNGGTLFLHTENCPVPSKNPGTANLSPGDYVKITIADTGIGMDPETQKHIFEPFFTTKEKERGTGLGLASAYGIIRNHQGIICVASQQNIGTQFTIYLPATEKPIITGKTAEESIHRGSGTILLIDDESIVTGVGEEMLETLGYRVITANSGPEALSAFAEQWRAIDLVILDIIMPGMGGKEVYERLKDIHPGIKVLLSSGYSVDDQTSKIMNQGCQGFIQKPFGLYQLSGKIKEILDSEAI